MDKETALLLADSIKSLSTDVQNFTAELKRFNDLYEHSQKQDPLEIVQRIMPQLMVKKES